MRGFTTRPWAALLVCGVLAWPISALAAERSSQEILTEIDKFQYPKIDREARKDPKANAEFVARYREEEGRREPLVRELLATDPDNDRLPELLGAMWYSQYARARDRRNEALVKLHKAGADKASLLEEANRPWFAGLVEEIDGVIARTRNDRMKLDGIYWKAFLAVEAHLDRREALRAVEEFIRAAPQDNRGASLLYDVAKGLADPEKQQELLTRVLADYPASDSVAAAERLLGKLAGLGKPFELEFTDAITARQVAIKDLRGKVVVIDFWATWCGPCVEEMPRMKALYEQYRQQGVEFIGISLDRAKEQGLEKLKAFVAANDIRWPQYYLADGSSKSKSSITQGVNGIPTVFVVDHEGKLFSVYARGKLETMLPELLKKRQVKADGP